MARHLDGIQPRASLLDLKRSAENLGIIARCDRLTLSELGQMDERTPGVAHVDGNHFVAVWADGGGVVVVDPPGPPQRMSRREFGRRWDGYILVISRPGEQPRFPWRFDWRRRVVGGVASLLAMLVLCKIRRHHAYRKSRERKGAGGPAC